MCILEVLVFYYPSESPDDNPSNPTIHDDRPITTAFTKSVYVYVYNMYNSPIILELKKPLG